MKKSTLLLFILIYNFTFSQNNSKTVHVNFINEIIKADGILNESSWGNAIPATNFWEYFPTDSLQAKRQAEIKMMFDDKNLYVGIKVNSVGKNFIVPLKKGFRKAFILFGKKIKAKAVY